MPLAAPWVELDIIILSQVSQKEKDKYNMISLLCRILKNDTHDLIYKIEMDSQTQKTNLWLQKGKCEGQREKLGVWG